MDNIKATVFVFQHALAAQQDHACIAQKHDLNQMMTKPLCCIHM